MLKRVYLTLREKKKQVIDNAYTRHFNAVDDAFSIEQIPTSNKKPVFAETGTRLLKAISIMQENDFSQLPILSDNGSVEGAITWDSIYKCINLDSTDSVVNKFIVETPSISKKESVFDAIPFIKMNGFIFVEYNNSLCGIITASDLCLFFKELSSSFGHICKKKNVIKRKVIRSINGELTDDDIPLEDKSSDTLFDYGKKCLKSKQYKTALKYFEKASEKGCNDACYRLAIMYLNGNPENDYRKAISYLKQAAENEHAISCSILGEFYYMGKYGLTVDYKLAYKYYSIAADKGNVKAIFYIGLMHDLRRCVGEDFKKVFDCYHQAICKGYMRAFYRQALMIYGKRYDFYNDINEAFRLCKTAAERDDENAQCLLGTMYYEGKGVEQNLLKSYRWYETAAINGDQYAEEEIEQRFYRCDNPNLLGEIKEIFEDGKYGFDIDRINNI